MITPSHNLAFLSHADISKDWQDWAVIWQDATADLKIIRNIAKWRETGENTAYGDAKAPSESL